MTKFKLCSRKRTAGCWLQEGSPKRPPKGRPGYGLKTQDSIHDVADLDYLLSRVSIQEIADSYFSLKEPSCSSYSFGNWVRFLRFFGTPRIWESSLSRHEEPKTSRCKQSIILLLSRCVFAAVVRHATTYKVCYSRYPVMNVGVVKGKSNLVAPNLARDKRYKHTFLARHGSHCF